MAAMMAAAPFDNLYAEAVSEDAQSLLEPSIEDFEEQERRSPLLSGFRSDSEVDDRSSTGLPWSPPGFKLRSANASGWFRHDPYGNYDLRPSMSPTRSRQTSPEVYQDATEGDPDITLAVNTPLPAGMDSPVRERSPEAEPHVKTGGYDKEESVPPTDNPNNCKQRS